MKSLVLLLLCTAIPWSLEVSQSVAPMQIVSSEPIHWKVEAYGNNGSIQLELPDLPEGMEILSRREREEKVGSEHLKTLEGILSSKTPGGYWLPPVMARDSSGVQTSAPAFIRIVAEESAKISLKLSDSRLPEWEGSQTTKKQHFGLLFLGGLAVIALGFYLRKGPKKEEVSSSRLILEEYLRSPDEPDQEVFEALYAYMETRNCPKARLDLLILPDFSAERLARLQEDLEHFRYAGRAFPLQEFTALVAHILEEMA